MPLPENLALLHTGEEQLRAESVRRVEDMPRVHLHFEVAELAMNLLDSFRQYPTNDEDTKTVQALALRIFNSHGAAIKLMLSGYYQHSGMVLRDILETTFLVDYFHADKSAISRWRAAPKKDRKKEFRPENIRDALDRRDGFTSKKRAELYALFSELAGHPTFEGLVMMRPKNGDLHGGPFLDDTTLEAVASEMGKLSVQVAEIFTQFLSSDWPLSIESAKAFHTSKLKWLKTFYSSAVPTT